MFIRRRPLMRGAMVGGAAYYAGKKVQKGREEDAMTEARIEQLEAQQMAAPPPAAAPGAPASHGISSAAIEQLKQLGELKEQGVLTEDEFEEQKRALLSGS